MSTSSGAVPMMSPYHFFDTSRRELVATAAGSPSTLASVSDIPYRPLESVPASVNVESTGENTYIFVLLA